MIDTATRSSRRISSMGSVYTSAIPASAAAFCAFSRVRLQMAATSQPSERKPGTWTCAPKPTPMMPILRGDEGTNCSRLATTERGNITGVEALLALNMLWLISHGVPATSATTFSSMAPPFDKTAAVTAGAVKRYLPWVVATALFMEQLDSTIVNTAVPSMAASLGVTPLSLKAVVASYIVSLAVGIPISGWIADRFGTRRVFSTAVALFTIASVACGLSVSVPMLIASRILQGLGAAMMTPVGRLAIIRTFDKSELLVAMNFVIIPALIGPLLGPTVGGLIVHWVSWREIFFVNVPMGIAALVIIQRYMPDYHGDAPRPLDFVGLVLFGSGMAILSWLLEIFGEHEIGAFQGGMLLLLSLSLLAAYVWHARQSAYPLLRLSLFKLRTFRVSVVGGFVTRLGIGGMPFLLPLLYQLALGLPAWESGLLTMPSAAAAMGMKFLLAAASPLWLSADTDRQHGSGRNDHLPVRAGHAEHAAGGHRAAGIGAGLLQLAAVLECKRHGLCRHCASRLEHGHVDREHLSAVVAELRTGVRLAHRRLVPGQRAADRSARRRERAASNVPHRWRLDDAVIARVLDVASGRWGQCQ